MKRIAGIAILILLVVQPGLAGKTSPLSRWIAPKSGSDPLVPQGQAFASEARFPEGIADVVESFDVVNARDFQLLPVHDAGEALGYEPGVGVQSFGGVGRPVNLSIWGSTSREVRVMVDGIPMNLPSTGSSNITQFPLTSIDRMEIVRGPASGAWGSANGGVVNLFTKDPFMSGAPRGMVGASAGGYGGAKFDVLNGRLELNGSQGQAGYFLATDWREGSGFRDNGDVRALNTFGKAAFPMADSRLKLEYGYNTMDAGGFDFPAANTGNTDNRFTRFGALTFSSARDQGAGLDITAYSTNQSANEKSFSLIPRADTGAVFSKDITQGVDVTLGQRIGGGLLVLGGDFGWDSFYHSSIGADRDLHRKAGYGNYEFKSGGWNFLAGGRWDENSLLKDQISYDGGVGYRFQGMPFRLRATAAHSWNAPPFLYREENDAAVAPNDNLGAEHANTFAVGIDGSAFAKVDYRMDFFFARVADVVRFATVSPGRLQATNDGREERMGVDGQISVPLPAGWAVTAGGGYVNIKDLPTKAIIEDPARPRLVTTSGIQYRDPSGLGTVLKARYIVWNSPDSMHADDGKAIFDLKITYEKGVSGTSQMVGFITVLNLFNSSNSWSQDYQLPGRFVEAGMEYRF